MKKDTLKKVLTIIVVIIGLIAIIYLLPYAKAITTEEGRLFFKDNIIASRDKSRFTVADMKVFHE